MLQASGYPLPRRVQVHGFLTVNGEKMSKRRGTFILARTYLDHLDPAYLRYYYASKLSGGVVDIDLNLDEFAAKVDADLVGKVVNLASRTARFMKGASLCEPYPEDGGLYADAVREGALIAAAYEACDTNQVTRRVMALADRANEYVEARAPWALSKQEGKEEEVRRVCSVALNLFRQITGYLEPVLPDLAAKSRELLNAGTEGSWGDTAAPLCGSPVAKFRHMMRRVDSDRIQAMLEASANRSD